MISWIMTIFGFAMAAVIFIQMRRGYLSMSKGLGWSAALILFCFSGLAPSLFDMFASKLGINYPPILAVVFATGVLTIKALAMDIENSELRITQRRLVQRIAILESDIERLSDGGSNTV